MLKTELLLTALLYSSAMLAAPKAELWSAWLPHAETMTVTLDHSPWEQFLEKRSRLDKRSVRRVDYANVTQEERHRLHRYIDALQRVTVSRLTRKQQKAYWINLYNSATVNIILEHYPVDSILDIDISPGWFSNGPWGKKILDIAGMAVSLDDIEHRILRPIWRDPRVHYALNCASVGCPDLQPEPFTAENLEDLLERAARQFIAHPRGVNTVNGDLSVSSIYVWFREDFGNTDEKIIQHLLQYAQTETADKLRQLEKISAHDYDWSLNLLQN